MRETTRIVVLGAGFGGLEAIVELDRHFHDRVGTDSGPTVEALDN